MFSSSKIYIINITQASPEVFAVSLEPSPWAQTSEQLPAASALSWQPHKRGALLGILSQPRL